MIVNTNRMNLLATATALLFFTNCGTKNKTAPQKEAVKAETKTQTSETKISVTGNVIQTNSYCGGAAPPDFLLEELATPRPFPDKKFHVIKGDANTPDRKIILSFTSDSAGSFSFQLESGTYSIILEEQISSPDAKKYKTESQSINEDCYKNWWAKPFYLLKAEESEKATGIKGLSFNFHHRCFISSDVPCLQYEGPAPP